MKTMCALLFAANVAAFSLAAMAESGQHRAAAGEGIVHSINMDARKINLTHEPIPALKWPEMTMDLPVAKEVDLSSVKPDDEITFYIMMDEDKLYRITEITIKAARDKH